jgi:hypothetical protein
MFSFYSGQGLVEHILIDISWIMVGNYVKRKEKKVMLDERWAKLPKVKKKKKRRKRKGKEKKRIEKKSVPLCSSDFMLMELDIKRS